MSIVTVQIWLTGSFLDCNLTGDRDEETVAAVRDFMKRSSEKLVDYLLEAREPLVLRGCCEALDNELIEKIFLNSVPKYSAKRGKAS